MPKVKFNGNFVFDGLFEAEKEYDVTQEQYDVMKTQSVAHNKSIPLIEDVVSKSEKKDKPVQ